MKPAATWQEETLRRLTLNDEQFVAGVLARRMEAPPIPSLDPRTQALASLAALIALDGAQAAMDGVVASALAAGATPSDLVDVLIAVAPSVGSARVVGAAPRLATALGLDVALALERFDDWVRPELSVGETETQREER